METVFLFTEDHGEITNPADYNITLSKYMVAPDPMLLVFLPVLII